MKNYLIVFGIVAISTNALAQTTHNIDVSIANNTCYALNVVEKLDQIEFYPNPVSDRLYIDTPIDKTQLLLFSSDGKEVLSKKLLKGENELDTSSLKQGIYTIHVISNEGAVKTFKLAIEK